MISWMTEGEEAKAKVAMTIVVGGARRIWEFSVAGKRSVDTVLGMGHTSIAGSGVLSGLSYRGGSLPGNVMILQSQG